MYQMYAVHTAYDRTGNPVKIMLSTVNCDEHLPEPQSQLLSTYRGVVSIRYFHNFSEVERMIRGNTRPRKQAIAKALISLIEACAGIQKENTANYRSHFS